MYLTRSDPGSSESKYLRLWLLTALSSDISPRSSALDLRYSSIMTYCSFDLLQSAAWSGRAPFDAPYHFLEELYHTEPADKPLTTRYMQYSPFAPCRCGALPLTDPRLVWISSHCSRLISNSAVPRRRCRPLIPQSLLKGRDGARPCSTGLPCCIGPVSVMLLSDQLTLLNKHITNIPRQGEVPISLVTCWLCLHTAQFSRQKDVQPGCPVDDLLGWQPSYVNSERLVDNMTDRDAKAIPIRAVELHCHMSPQSRRGSGHPPKELCPKRSPCPIDTLNAVCYGTPLLNAQHNQAQPYISECSSAKRS